MAATQPVWNRIGICGEFHGHPSGYFSLTPQTFDQIVNTFDREGVHVRWDFSHQSELPLDKQPPGGVPSAGWITRLERRGKELWALSEFLPETRKLIVSGAFKYASPAVRLDSLDPVTGRNVGAKLSSCALCTSPFLKNLGTVQAGDVATAFLCSEFTQAEITALADDEISSRSPLGRALQKYPSAFAAAETPWATLQVLTILQKSDPSLLGEAHPMPVTPPAIVASDDPPTPAKRFAHPADKIRHERALERAAERERAAAAKIESARNDEAVRRILAEQPKTPTTTFSRRSKTTMTQSNPLSLRERVAALQLSENLTYDQAFDRALAQVRLLDDQGAAGGASVKPTPMNAALLKQYQSLDKVLRDADAEYAMRVATENAPRPPVPPIGTAYRNAVLLASRSPTMTRAEVDALLLEGQRLDDANAQARRDAMLNPPMNPYRPGSGN